MWFRNFRNYISILISQDEWENRLVHKFDFIIQAFLHSIESRPNVSSFNFKNHFENPFMSRMICWIEISVFVPFIVYIVTKATNRIEFWYVTGRRHQNQSRETFSVFRLNSNCTLCMSLFVVKMLFDIFKTLSTNKEFMRMSIKHLFICLTTTNKKVVFNFKKITEKQS